MNKHTKGPWVAAFPKGQFPHIQTSDGKQVVKTDCSINSGQWVEDYGECVAIARRGGKYVVVITEGGEK